MGRPRNYECKTCSYKGSSPNDLHAHYVGYPTHKRSYVPKAERAAKPSTSKSNGLLAANPARSEAFGQLDALRKKFEAEVAREEATIEQLKISLEGHELELRNLRAAMEVLLRATPEEGSMPHPHEKMQHVPGRSLAS